MMLSLGVLGILLFTALSKVCHRPLPGAARAAGFRLMLACQQPRN